MRAGAHSTSDNYFHEMGCNLGLAFIEPVQIDLLVIVSPCEREDYRLYAHRDSYSSGMGSQVLAICVRYNPMD